MWEQFSCERMRQMRPHSADTPAQPYVPLIYRSLMLRDGLKHEPDDVIDLTTGERESTRVQGWGATPTA